MATIVQSRTNQAKDTISFPILTYSDAAPGDDLRNLDNASQRTYEQGVVTQQDFRRPQTADTGIDRRPGAGATFDFRLTAPPDEAIPSSAHSCGSPLGPKMIGIALGSPGMIDSQPGLPPPSFNTFISAEPQPGQSLPRKSKWKKIGGLFRAKNALASPTQAVRPDWERTSRPQEVPLVNLQQMKRRKASFEEWPRIQPDPKSQTDSKYSSPQRSRKFSSSRETPCGDKLESLGPRLNVNIPDIQMERYSVMFSSVMNKNQRPNLLARRAKTLDSLNVPSHKEFLASSAKPPPLPIRRATSPARSSFTLFPTAQPSKAAQVLGTQTIPQNFSRRPSPRLRSNTNPVENPSKSPPEPPRGIPGDNNMSSNGSPFVGDILSSQANTPRSSSSNLRKEDKPLPAIKSEQPTRLRSRKMSPQDIRAAQSSLQQHQCALQPEDKPPTKGSSRRKRPNLTINTGQEPPPPPEKDAKDKSSSKSALQSVASAPRITADLMMVTESPEVLAPKRNPLRVKISASPLERFDPKSNPVQSNIIAFPVETSASKAIETSDPNPNSLLAELPQSPLVAEPKNLDPKKAQDLLPIIEVSTARSISVKRGKGTRQMLVPIGARVDNFNSTERFVDRKTLTPHITDVHHGHKHARSQELQIESL
ncbi:uncharacterized protein N7477_006290 [Penicillium maclennaniae]|uniref:uncharacterized protein n=1 Tax=Penicillium maclennaniae TaxID=1343394 RepID=UPI0025415767|nr:uncharacterized protein N7477_006290 [Penicillium maclennaniae]KAJ5667720.1 hypothetical protein N7477_006290 [Penicillium maclennaniae]